MEIDRYGMAHLNLKDVVIAEKPMKELAWYWGTELGCPKIPRLIKENRSRKMATRYFELVFYYRYLIEKIKEKDPRLVKDIEGKQPRKKDEILRDYDKESTPLWARVYFIPGTETHVGYELPRLVTSFSGPSRLKALNIFERTLDDLKDGEDNKDLLLSFAENLTTKMRANPREILQKTIGLGLLEQNSLYSSYKEVVKRMETKAPILWDAYEKMSPGERKHYKIANIEL